MLDSYERKLKMSLHLFYNQKLQKSNLHKSIPSTPTILYQFQMPNASLYLFFDLLLNAFPFGLNHLYSSSRNFPFQLSHSIIFNINYYFINKLFSSFNTQAMTSIMLYCPPSHKTTIIFMQNSFVCDSQLQISTNSQQANNILCNQQIPLFVLFNLYKLNLLAYYNEEKPFDLGS